MRAPHCAAGIALVLLFGCGQTHERGDGGADATNPGVDAASPRDAGGVDAGHPDERPPGWDIDCDRHGELCRCVLGERTCDALPDAYCPGVLLVCIPRPWERRNGGLDNGSLHDLELSADQPHLPERYCWSGRLLLSIDETLAEDGRIAGPCMPRWICEAARDVEIGARCRYTDGSVFENGPPDEGACPPAPAERTPFCGGDCWGCPDHHLSEHMPLGIHCMGQSEERGFGICAFGDSPCERGRPGLALRPGSCELAYGGPCACMRLRNSQGELREWGHATLAASCVAYRERYPGSVECMDPHAWEPLP